MKAEKEDALGWQATGRKQQQSEESMTSPMQAMVAILSEADDFSRLRGKSTSDGWISLVNLEKVLSEHRGTLRYRLRNLDARIVIGDRGRSERQYMLDKVAACLGVST